MFTGIIEELGQVVELVPGADSARVTVRGPVVTADAVPGASISVNGVCLTVVDLPGKTRDTFTADVMAQTLALTSLAGVAPGVRVNLERRSRPVAGSAGTSSRGTWTAPAPWSSASPATAGNSSGSPSRPTCPATSWPRVRSRSTGSR